MEDTKTYSVVGTVTIGSDEYRDLIVDKTVAEKERDDYRSKYWNEQSRAKGLSTELESLKRELSKYKEYIKAHDEEGKLKLWLFNNEGN